MPRSLHRAALRTLTLFLGLTAASWTASAAPALHVEESIELPAPPAQVWATVGHFDSLSWHPVVADTRLDQGTATRAGAVRVVTTRDGARIVESLQRLDARHRSMVYRIVESPLPVKGYESTLTVQPQGRGSKVVWSSHFERDEQAAGVTDDKAREIVAGIYRAGFDGLKARFKTP